LQTASASYLAMMARWFDAINVKMPYKLEIKYKQAFRLSVPHSLLLTLRQAPQDHLNLLVESASSDIASEYLLFKLPLGSRFETKTPCLKKLFGTTAFEAELELVFEN
jgi:hypothetical protein